MGRIREIHNSIVKKEIKITELIEDHIKVIEEKEPEINAVITRTFEQAIERAKVLEEQLSEQVPLLYGIPFSVKDNIAVENVRLTCASKILSNFISPYTATSVKRLFDQGAILLAKTNMDEFAMGSSTETSFFGVVKNPIDTERVAGGSSGGSAAIVRYGGSVFSLGSDTGGSIRQPASFCGVVGLRPTYGTVSRYGLVAFASSLDIIGPLALTVEDVEIVYNTIKGRDIFDSTSMNPLPFHEKKDDRIKVGIIKEAFELENMDKRIRDGIIEVVERLGYEIMELSFPYYDYIVPVYQLISMAEASSNLARYDGVRYGLRIEGDGLKEMYIETRSSGFGEEVKRRISAGAFVLSAGYFDEYYIRAQKIRTFIKKEMESFFNKVDIILSPTVPEVAFRPGEKKESIKMYLSDILTVPPSLAGMPALSVPLFEIDGLPVSIQIVGPRFSEPLLFYTGRRIEESR